MMPLLLSLKTLSSMVLFKSCLGVLKSEFINHLYAPGPVLSITSLNFHNIFQMVSLCSFEKTGM